MKIARSGASAAARPPRVHCPEGIPGARMSLVQEIERDNAIRMAGLCLAGAWRIVPLTHADVRVAPATAVQGKR